jgi:diguanylate cyclase (GGDEF)-like protein
MNSKIKVLIVDDSVTSRTMIAKHLSDSYECLKACDGEEAWDLLLQDESITLIFADMHMPILNGMLLLKRIRESNIERIASIPVIIITGHEDSEAAKRASYSVGATDFISKPFVRSEILCCAGSFTRQGRVITAIENDAAKEVLSALHDNEILAKFGSKTIAYSERHKDHASIMYVQIANMESFVESHGIDLMSKVAEEINDLLENSLREEEIVSQLGVGKYAVILPSTKIFKANIVANRLRQTADKLSFQFAGGVHQFSLAIGITSTESSDVEARYLTFGEYCIQAQHALNMSLESRKNHIVRFDETYEKAIQNETSCKQPKYKRDATKAHKKEINISDADHFNNMFSDILIGDYSNISASIMEEIIEPLEMFLKYAKSIRTNTGVKKAG